MAGETLPVKEETLEELLNTASYHRDTISVEQLLDVIQKLTYERSVLYDALKRVQHACTEKEMEIRRLKGIG
jgi:hypothetical protein